MGFHEKMETLGAMDCFQLLFLCGAVLLMLVQSIRGWRTGVVRQLVNLAALVVAYGWRSFSQAG